jgi:peptide/nickel transport system substrate-binding protein
MKNWIMFLVSCAFLFVTASCSPGKPAGGQPVNESPVYRDTINIGVDVDPESYVPILWRNTTAARVGMLIFDGLIYNDPSVNPQPQLAASWDNPDDKTWIFHLRQGVTFHNGKTLTATDVKYTFDAIRDPANNAPYRSRYASIDSVEAVDDYTVQFNLNKPFAAILVYMDLGILPEGALDNPDFGFAPIGTGPYKLTEYVLNSVSRLEANPSYWGGVPGTAKINVHVINDNSVRIAALQSGDVDFVCSPLSANDLPAVENDPNLKMEKTASLGITYIGFSMKHPVLSDLAVRQAIAYMADKESIAKNFYNGMDIPGQTPLQHISWAASPSLHGYEFSREKAIQTLADAGWKDSNGDGVLDKNGQSLSFTLATHTDDTSRYQVVEYMQNALQSIGMKVDVSVTEWALFSEDMMQNRTQAWVAGWLNLLDPDRMFDMFHSTSGSNYGQYYNAEVDRLLEEARASFNQEERKANYQKAAQIVTDEVYYITLLDQAYIAAYTNKLEAYQIYPSGSYYSMRNVKIAQ